MLKSLFPFVIIVSLSACKATTPPPFQADREPEDRTRYHGVEGLVQHQKDQRYLMDKELADKCREAKVDLAVAESQGDQQAVERFAGIISKSCKS